ARSGKTGRILRARHGGLNKFAPEGKVFRAKALAFIMEGKILQDRGRLMASVTSESAVVAGTFQVVIGTNVKYGAAHQFGVPGRGLAERPFLVIQDEDADQFEDFLTRWLRDGSAQ